MKIHCLIFILFKYTRHKMKFDRKKNPPSIQDPKNAYGFEEGPNGELIPQPAPERDASIGPAFYNSVIIFIFAKAFSIFN
jgi:hypothetical protein